VTQTYSQSITGINAGARYNAPANVRVGDTDINGNVTQNWAPDAAGALTSRNNYILCKNPDGSQSYYRVDAERSIPGVSLVMIPV
jgi:hypothetical protein